MFSQEGRGVQIPWGHGTVSQPAAPAENFHPALSPTRPTPGGLGVSGSQESRWFLWGRKQVPDPGSWAHASCPGHGRRLTWAQHGAGQREVRGELGCLSECLFLVSLCVGFAQPAADAGATSPLPGVELGRQSKFTSRQGVGRKMQNRPVPHLHLPHGHWLHTRGRLTWLPANGSQWVKGAGGCFTSSWWGPSPPSCPGDSGPFVQGMSG